MIGIYDKKYGMMDPNFVTSPDNPVTANWINQIYVGMERELPFPETGDSSTWTAWKEKLRSRLREMMYIDTWGDCGRIPQYEILDEEKCYNYTKQKISIETVPGNYAIAYLLIPDIRNEKVPGIMCPCGHTMDGIESIVNPDAAQSNGHGMAYGHEFAMHGCIVIAPENAGYGKRDIDETACMTDLYKPALRSCDLMYRRLNHIGRDLTGLRIFELTLYLNLLCSFPGVDSKRIGCVGLSGGCWLSQVLAGLDDRISAVVLSGYFTTFAQTAWNGHCLCHHPHGIGKLCDMTDISALIAPRPQFVESGSMDTNYPSEPAYSIVKRAYQYCGSEANLDIDVYEGGHMFRGEKSIPWLMKILEHQI